jgi:glucose/arabinose dehydrogenase
VRAAILLGMRRLPLVLLAAVVLTACGSGPGAGATVSAPATSATPASAPPASGAASGVRLQRVGRFQAPLYVTAPPGDRRRIMVVEQGGRIVVVRGGRILRTPFLDLSGIVTAGGEQGLLGLAFDPEYASSGRLYVYFTRRDGRQEVAEYRRGASADVARPGSRRTVLVMADPASNHNGGDLKFGPDGLLYIGTGDGGGANDQFGRRGNAQNRGSLLGKILRIDPVARGGRAYTVPSSNPFAGRAGMRAEIYAWGLRNPWRWSFDRQTGDVTIADVGQSAIEEVNFARRGDWKGANFGWRPLEGTRRNFDEPAPGAVPPVIEQSHDEGWCSITGGYVVRDPGLRALDGRYVYGDFCKGQIRAATLAPGRASGDRSLGLPTVAQLSSFGEDAQGRVYVVSLAGPVYRLAAR